MAREGIPRPDPSKAPWAIALLGFALGAYVLPPWGRPGAVACILLFPLLLACCLTRTRPALGYVLACLAWALFGSWRVHMLNQRQTELVFPGNKDVLARIEGIIASLPAHLPTPATAARTGRIRFEIAQLKVNGRPVGGRLVTYVTASEPIAAPGDLVRFRCRLEPLSHAANPGATCPGCQQRLNGVVGIATLPVPDLLTLQEPAKGGILYLPLRFAHTINQRLRRAMPPRVFPLGAALLTGEYRQLPRSVMRQIQVAGLLHLLAISGLHFAIVAGCVWLLLRPFGLPLRATCLVVAAATIFFCMMTGARPSAFRATVLILVHLAGLCVRRPPRRFNNLAFAALLILGVRPWDLVNPGFQLSFVSVAAMYWLVPPVLRLVERLVVPANPLFYLGRSVLFKTGLALARWTMSCMAISGTLVLVVAPLSAAHFGHVPLGGIILTAAALPLVTLALPLLCLAVILPGPPAPACLVAASWLLEMLLNLVSCSSRFADIGTLPGHTAYIVLLPLMPLAASLWLRLERFRAAALRHRLRVVAVVAVILLSAGCVPQHMAEPSPSSLSVTVLNVGHGLCVLGVSSQGSFLYDAGSMGGPEVVIDAVEKATRTFGVSQFEYVLVSHADADHLNGLPALIERFRIRRVLVPPALLETESLSVSSFLDAIRARGIPLQATVRGDVFPLGPAVRLHVLHPPAGRHYGTANEASVVVRVYAYGSSLLLTGDLEGWGMVDFLAENKPAPVDVLVAPHHGGKSSNPPEFYEALRPRVAIASATRRWGYPMPLEHINRQHTDVMITALCGAVTWRAARGKQPELAIWLHGRPRWRSLMRPHIGWVLTPNPP